MPKQMAAPRTSARAAPFDERGQGGADLLTAGGLDVGPGGQHDIAPGVADVRDRRLRNHDIAGVQRARVYRVYLRAARSGFLTGYVSVYQVLAHRPTSARYEPPAGAEPAGEYF